MSFIKLKSVYMHNEGLKLEEYDVDKLEICTETLKQLLLIDNEPLATPLRSHINNASIPSSKATRFGGQWNLPRIPFERSTMCRSADFYEGSFNHRLPARSSSEPDLPQRSENHTVLLVRPQHHRLDKSEQNFIIQGTTVLPHIESSPSRTTSSYTRKTQYSCVPQLRLSSPYRDENEKVEFPPLSARQCFPSQKQQITLNHKDDKKKIKPMKRNMTFNKYFQSRFGRNLEQNSDDVLKKLTMENWKLHGREFKRDPEQRRIAIQKVVEHIFRPQEDYGKEANELDNVLEESFKCTGFKSL